jgi:hypothetical protein
MKGNGNSNLVDDVLHEQTRLLLTEADGSLLDEHDIRDGLVAEERHI